MGYAACGGWTGLCVTKPRDPARLNSEGHPAGRDTRQDIKERLTIQQ